MTGFTNIWTYLHSFTQSQNWSKALLKENKAHISQVSLALSWPLFLSSRWQSWWLKFLQTGEEGVFDCSPWTSSLFNKSHNLMGWRRVCRWFWGATEAFAMVEEGGKALDFNSEMRMAGPWGSLWRIEVRRQHRCPPPWTSWKTADGCPDGGRSFQT